MAQLRRTSPILTRGAMWAERQSEHEAMRVEFDALRGDVDAVRADMAGIQTTLDRLLERVPASPRHTGATPPRSTAEDLRASDIWRDTEARAFDRRETRGMSPGYEALSRAEQQDIAKATGKPRAIFAGTTDYATAHRFIDKWERWAQLYVDADTGVSRLPAMAAIDALAGQLRGRAAQWLERMTDARMNDGRGEWTSFPDFCTEFRRAFPNRRSTTTSIRTYSRMRTNAYTSYQDFITDYDSFAAAAAVPPHIKATTLMEHIRRANKEVATTASCTPLWMRLEDVNHEVTEMEYRLLEDFCAKMFTTHAWFRHDPLNMDTLTQPLATDELATKLAAALAPTTPSIGSEHGSSHSVTREKNVLKPAVYAAIVENNQRTGWSPRDETAILRRNKQREEGRCFNCNELLSAGCGGYRVCKTKKAAEQPGLRKELRTICTAPTSVEEQLCALISDYEQQHSLYYTSTWPEDDEHSSDDDDDEDEHDWTVAGGSNN